MKIMKLDFTKILILFLLVSTIGFGLTWYFGGFDASKERVKQLEEDYKKLEKEKEAAEAKIVAWKEIFDKKDKEDKKMTQEVINAKTDANVAKINAEKAKAELTKLQGGMSQTRKEIEEMRNNPKTLTDDELLEDLIKNTSSIQPKVNKVSEITNNGVEIKHKVKAGETLYSLSKEYNISVSEIMEQNKFLTKKGLQPGQTLTIKTN
jgi:LysM repeat protein